MKKNVLSLMTGAVIAAAGLVNQAAAATAPGEIKRFSHITTNVENNGDGSYTYHYTVWNDSPGGQLKRTEEDEGVWPAIVGYEIPLNSPGDVTGILPPETWDWRFISAAQYEREYGMPNPFYSLYVLQWYDAELNESPPAKMIVPENYNATFEADEYEPSADGFSLVSGLAPVDGPYANLWLDRGRNIGDPPLPGGGPIGGGAIPYTPVPEVSAPGWLALGMLMFGFFSKRRRRLKI